MRTKDFVPSQFFDVLEDGMTIKSMAKKMKCSETTDVLQANSWLCATDFN